MASPEMEFSQFLGHLMVSLFVGVPVIGMESVGLELIHRLTKVVARLATHF